MNDLERRRIATEKTLLRYRHKVFDWRKGITCIHMARFQMRNMGHKVPTIPRIRSALGAKKALKARGWESVGQMLDSLFPRIAPAEMLPGDLAMTPGQEGLDCILVTAGPLKFVGWHPETGEFVLYDDALEDVTGAWRL